MIGRRLGLMVGAGIVFNLGVISHPHDIDPFLDENALEKQHRKLEKLVQENTAMKIKLAKVAKSNTGGTLKCLYTPSTI